LKLSADRPDVLRPQRRLAPVNLPLFQGVRLDVAGDGFSLSCISFSSFVRMTSMASIQPLPLSDRRPLTGVDLPRPALVGEAVRDPKRSFDIVRRCRLCNIVAACLQLHGISVPRLPSRFAKHSG
jgi:hypothetical protein